MTALSNRDSVRRKRWLFLLCGVLLLLSGAALRIYERSPVRSLPYKDSFAKGEADEWKAFGGTWEVDGSAMRNDSDERGAKLLTGSSFWRDYSIEADVKLLGTAGDAGLVIRSSDEEQGVDSYTGYYAGLRSLDHSLVIGRAGHGWHEDVHTLDASSVPVGQWTHLKLLAYGCQIVATVTLPPRGQTVTVSVTDRACIPSGRAGLRSYASGGAWRNVVVQSASQLDLVAMLGKQKEESVAGAKSVPANEQQRLGFDTSMPQHNFYAFHSSLNTQTASSLRLAFLSKPAQATIRGNVILTSPSLFVQDITGGVSVPQPTLSSALKVGDQVEVTGEVHTSDFSSTFQHAKVQVLWEGTPVPPVTVTASQAATAAFDATFIEVEGRLRAKRYGPDNTLIFDFDAGPQSFSAFMNRSRGDSLFNMLKPNSLLRLRGVCVVDAAFTHNLAPFVLLLRSADDVDMLAGPPWWSAGHLAAIVICLLLLALVGNFVHHRVEHWRLRAVVEERGRLAHEMHDTLAQSFAGIGFQLEAIRTGVPKDLSRTHQQLNLASDLVRHSHEEARSSIASLRPESHESGDLLAALEVSARRLVEGGSVRVVALSTGDVYPLPLRITDTLFRIGQEAIANAVRHAHATELCISLTYTRSHLCLQVKDNGLGFVQDGEVRGFGIRGMRKRAASIAATIRICGTAGQGTDVQIETPLPPRATLTSWPRFLWKYVKERNAHV